MTKIALTAAALLVATGSAFASSDDYGNNHSSRNADQPVASQSILIDNSHTASIRNSHSATIRNPDASAQKPVFGADRELFGN